ncbi:MAG: hypothetical protein H0V89_02305 [Deltaproteobacteria bacterium]|nr:hypothetical protein [Deltaproteobacteria bacterium]
MSDENPPPLEPQARDFVASMLRRVLRRGQREVERAAVNGRTRLELRQLQADLDHFWVRLGKTAWHLVEGGEIEHPDLRRAMTRITELEARIESLKRPPPERL